MVASTGIWTVGSVANAVLVSQLFLNLGVDLLDGLLSGDFKEASASIFGKFLQDLFSVRMILLGKAAPSSMMSPTAEGACARIVKLLIGKQDGVDHGVRA